MIEFMKTTLKQISISLASIAVFIAVCGCQPQPTLQTTAAMPNWYIREYSGLVGITNSPGGNLWFTEFNGVGKITLLPEIHVNFYHVPNIDASPSGITAGPDGDIWFTEREGNKIGKVSSATGIITTYAIPSAKAGVCGITAGPDGNIWFTEYNTSKIGKISTAGQIMEYRVANAKARPNTITAGDDGNLWFSEEGANKIGKISPTTGLIVPSGSPSPPAIKSGKYPCQAT